VRKFTASRVRSFGHALEGWGYVLRSQRNIWVEMFIAALVLVTAAWLRLGTLEWVAILLTTAIVFAAEFFNTAIEVMVDLASPKEHVLAKRAKDVSAAAVLLTAIAATFIGMLILGPALLVRIQTLISR